jgi:hypothetical protein
MRSMDTDHLDLALIAGLQRDAPFVLAWPTDTTPAGFLYFPTATEWRAFVASLRLPHGIPEIVAAKYRRAQMLYFLAWLYPDLIKAGELVSLTTLELALRDRYGLRIKSGKHQPSFATLLKYMVDQGLADRDIPMVRRSGGTVIGFLTGENQPSLSQRRNLLAHGDPFDGLPCSGLLELVRDLIIYVYQEMLLGV